MMDHHGKVRTVFDVLGRDKGSTFLERDRVGGTEYAMLGLTAREAEALQDALDGRPAQNHRQRRQPALDVPQRLGTDEPTFDQLTQYTLTPLRYSTQHPIAGHLLEGQGAKITLHDEINHAVVRIESQMLTDKLLDRVSTVTTETEMPWTMTVGFKLPYRWYHRLLRRAPRVIWKEVSGTARGYGKIPVRLEHRVNFPAPRFPYPQRLGPIVAESTVEAAGRCTWDSVYARRSQESNGLLWAAHRTQPRR